jgi:hypothetical protein
LSREQLCLAWTSAEGSPSLKISIADIASECSDVHGPR